MDSVFLQSPHRRWNPLKRDWVIVSPHRTQRPWQGQIEKTAAVIPVPYDPHCYLCPGNTRALGQRNPSFTRTYIFDNDYSALELNIPEAYMDPDGKGLLRAATERGICRVMCFHSRHDLTIATMTTAEIRDVVSLWTEQEHTLGELSQIKYVQIFENRGAMMGASNPHPHCQIWATEHVPGEPATELSSQQAYLAEYGTALLSAYLRHELAAGERIVTANMTWVAVVPFWAVWPFEILLLPKRRVATLHGLSAEEHDGLAMILKKVTAAYNKVFEAPFPYSMGFHPAPTDGDPHLEWHLHAHFYPPLLRSASVRKFMVGFELLGSPQRDVTAETAAGILRESIVRVKDCDTQ